MREEILSYVSYSLGAPLAWCSSVKNTSLNSYGCSPNQVVFRYNPNFSLEIDHKFTASEGVK